MWRIIVVGFLAIVLVRAQQYGALVGYNYPGPGYVEESGFREGGNFPISKRAPFALPLRTPLVRLNELPQVEGVTPINGALLLKHVDLVIRGRNGLDLEIARYYSSKIWFGTVEDSANRVYRDTLRPYSWLGKGWNLDWGEFYDWSDTMNYLMPSTKVITFIDSLSTDGSFLRYHMDQYITSKDGSRTAFGYSDDGKHCFVESITDAAGNYLKFFRVNSVIRLGKSPFQRMTFPIDSIHSSLGAAVRFYWQQDTFPGDARWVRLDSIRYAGFNGQTLAIRYRYQSARADSSPFGAVSFCDSLGAGGRTWLLRAVVYPNGDSVRYTYNKFLELDSIISAFGGVTRYRYGSYYYHVPSADSCKPPEYSTGGEISKHSRGVDTIFTYDPVTAQVCTTGYRRRFTPLGSGNCLSNPDSVLIVDAEHNKTTMTFKSSHRLGPIYKWNYRSGVLDSTVFYDRDDSIVKREYIRDSSITVAGKRYGVIDSVTTRIGGKLYVTRYRNYDNYGNVGLIYEKGDRGTSADDRSTRIRYSHDSTTHHTFWLKIWPHGDPAESLFIQAFSLVGIESLKTYRKWIGTYTPDTLRFDTAWQGPHPTFIEKHLRVSSSNDSDSVVVVRVTAREITTGDTICVCDTYALKLGGPEGNNPVYKGLNRHYRRKWIVSLPETVSICSDTNGLTPIAKTVYSYDDTSNIVALNYPYIKGWQSPTLFPSIRGNLTKVEQWRDGSSYTKTEFRHDSCGNVVRTINWVTGSKAETTFVHYKYYDEGANQAKYQYAYPYRTVEHLASSPCSLVVRAEYDLPTGLVTRSVDPNLDSTRYEYDNMSRLTKVWRMGENDNSRWILYKDTESPRAVVDSTKLDNSRWMRSKTSFDGFGRAIITYNYDPDSGRTIVTKTAYNKNGQVAKVCNPYYVSYGSEPSWGDPADTLSTRFYYDGLGRMIKTLYPNGDSTMIKYGDNWRKVINEKSDTTRYFYNAFADLDSVVGPLNDTTRYTHDLLGNLTKVTDGTGKKTTYTYDNLSRLIKMNSPDARISSSDSFDAAYDYDDIGNLTQKIDGKGCTRYTYDNLNRPTLITNSPDTSSWPDTVRCTYDTSPPSPPSGQDNPKGRLTKMVTVGTDSIIYYYDDWGRVRMKKVGLKDLSWIGPIKYDYNDADLCTLLTYPFDEFGMGFASSVRYQYNRLGRLVTIPNYVSAIDYYAAGQTKLMNYTNDAYFAANYDRRLRPLSIVHQKGGTKLFDNAFRYDPCGNIMSIHDTVTRARSETLLYDALSRLVKVKFPNTPADSHWFAYDKVGNRVRKDSLADNYKYFTSTNRCSTDHRDWTYTYDYNGNITDRSNTHYTYDWNNRMTQYYRGNLYDGDTTVYLRYDASGLRVRKQVIITAGGGDGNPGGKFFEEPLQDLAFKTSGPDSTNDPARDLGMVEVENTEEYLKFYLKMKQAYGALHGNHARIFITLDVDTLMNSGRLSLPEDAMTKLSRQAGWEYCVYVQGMNDFGLYQYSNNSVVKKSKPLGLAVEIENGPEKMIKITVAKYLINNPSCVRFTVTTQKPGFKNNGKRNGGSSSIDIFPGQGEFPGRIPGFVQVFTPDDDTTDAIQIIDPITYYFYDGINPITEVDDYGTVTANYVYAGGLHVARVTSDTFWYHCDALGSPRRMTDRSGSEVWTCFYYPFGEQKWPESEQISNSHQFTGKEYDVEMSLNYFCQRYYDATIGRFMSLDPERPAASSPYAYCLNNPLRFIDPLGRKAQVQAQEFLEKLFDEKWTLAQSGISQLAPEIFGPGWQYTWMDKVRRATWELSYQLKWGSLREARMKAEKAGKKHPYSELLRKLKEWKYVLEKGGLPFFDPGDGGSIHLPVWVFNEADQLAVVLVHEGTHAWLQEICSPQRAALMQTPHADWAYKRFEYITEGMACFLEVGYYYGCMSPDAGTFFGTYGTERSIFGGGYGTWWENVLWRGYLYGPRR